MDPWENTIDEALKTPEDDRILHKHVDNHSTSKYRPRKGDKNVDIYDENQMYLTPQSNKADYNAGEKENKFRFRLYSQARTQKINRVEEVEEQGNFKKPL